MVVIPIRGKVNIIIIMIKIISLTTHFYLVTFSLIAGNAAEHVSSFFFLI